MRIRNVGLVLCALIALTLAATQMRAKEPVAKTTGESAPSNGEAASAAGTPAEKPSDEIAATSAPTKIKPAAIAPFVTKGIAWLIAAQGPDGGWGGGSHAHQEVRDPHQVSTDPATTAFTLLSLLRAGHTPVAGEYKVQVRRGLEYLITAVEKAPADGPKITELTGTQPQTKMGQYVDTPLTAQYLSRAVGMLEKTDPLYTRADAALDKCLAKLQASQEENGGWGQGGGWAPVLQSSFGCSAFEIAKAGGKDIDDRKLECAREYQKQQVTTAASGTVTAKTDSSAGVELYAFNGALRGNASDVRGAQAAVEDAVKSGKLAAGSAPTRNNLKAIGLEEQHAQRLAQAAEQNDAQIRKLDDENLLAGFGNNGGEEYVSYLLTSESLVIAGGDRFNPWNDKMHGRLQKVQNADGSWAGLHCITSPVFCTAAVVQCLTTDRDAEFLIAMAERTHKTADKVAASESEKK